MEDRPTVFDPTQLEELCDADLPLQAALAEAARTDTAAAKTRVLTALNRVFEEQLVMAAVAHYEAIAPLLVDALLVRRFSQESPGDGDT